MTPPNDDTEQLVKRAAAGDRSAMGQLVDRHRNRLRRMIAVPLSPRIEQRVDPSDLIQDTMAEAAIRIREYANDQAVSFYPWLRCLAFQRLAKAHRYHIAAEKRSVDREDGVGVALSDDSILQLASQLVANHSTPSERLNRREVKLRVRSALDDRCGCR